MAIRMEDYKGVAQELTTQANRNGSPVKAKCARCFDTIAIVGKTDDSTALAEKLFSHKQVCPRTVVLIH
jgi:hypothetical protein